MAKLFIFGDSIAAGAWDERGGWANRVIGEIMAKQIALGFEQGFYCLPYNLGVSGDTIPHILERFDREVAARMADSATPESIQLVFSIGSNDALYMLKENRPSYTDDEFAGNLRQLIAKARTITDNITFTGLLPVDDAIVNPLPWAPDVAYACGHMQRFEKIIEATCREEGLPFLPLFDSWSRQNYRQLLIDGVHPNSEGHAFLAQQIGDFLLTPDFIKFHSA